MAGPDHWLSINVSMSEFLLRDPEVKVEMRIVSLQFNRPPDEFNGQRMVAKLACHHTKKVKRVHVTRFRLENLLVQLSSAIQFAALMESKRSLKFPIHNKTARSSRTRWSTPAQSPGEVCR